MLPVQHSPIKMCPLQPASSAGFDAYCRPLRGGSVVDQLRRGVDFNFEPRPTLSRLRSGAAPFVPWPQPVAPTLQAAVTLEPPPAPPQLWPMRADSLCAIPLRPELEQRLRPLYRDDWYQDVLVPELLKVAGKSMSATHFVSLYYFILSLCNDAATDDTLTLMLLGPKHNALIGALLPDGAAQAHVSAQMQHLEQLEAATAPQTDVHERSDAGFTYAVYPAQTLG